MSKMGEYRIRDPLADSTMRGKDVPAPDPVKYEVCRAPKEETALDVLEALNGTTYSSFTDELNAWLGVEKPGRNAPKVGFWEENKNIRVPTK